MTIIPAHESDIGYSTGRVDLPADAATAGKSSRAGRPKRIGDFRRLDIEITKSDCDRIDDVRSTIGARSTVEVIRHALRVFFFLLAKNAEGYDLFLINGREKTKVELRLS